MIFNIQKCSIHDGAGIRTIVFFKGCPLHCKWCANPESQSFQKEIMQIPRKCIHCGACMRVCPNSAVYIDNGEVKINRDLCDNCLKCTDVCYAESLESVGRYMEVEELFKEINKDKLYYQMYGGGVTFSGGEPLAQPQVLIDLAKKCKQNRINTSIETCGYGNYEEFKYALDYIDSMFIDLKHMDSEIHKQLTGFGNDAILENIKKIATHGIPITIRTPVIPGCNDSAENIKAIAEFIKDISNIMEYELLPYHNLGSSKYASLGIQYQLEEVEPPADEQIIKLVKLSNQVLRPFGKQCFYIKKNKKEIML